MGCTEAFPVFLHHVFPLARMFGQTRKRGKRKILAMPRTLNKPFSTNTAALLPPFSWGYFLSEADGNYLSSSCSGKSTQDNNSGSSCCYTDERGTDGKGGHRRGMGTAPPPKHTHPGHPNTTSIQTFYINVSWCHCVAHMQTLHVMVNTF